MTRREKNLSYSWTSSPLLTFVSVSYWKCPPSVHWTTVPLHLSLPSHRTCPQFPLSPYTFLLPSKSPSSFPLSPSPSQVTPVRPLIRILSLGKCIVTGRWQLHVCVCPRVCERVTVWAGCWRWRWQPPGIFNVAGSCSRHWPDSQLNYTEGGCCVCVCVWGETGWERAIISSWKIIHWYASWLIVLLIDSLIVGRQTGLFVQYISLDV